MILLKYDLPYKVVCAVGRHIQCSKQAVCSFSTSYNSRGIAQLRQQLYTLLQWGIFDGIKYVSYNMEIFYLLLP